MALTLWLAISAPIAALVCRAMRTADPYEIEMRDE